MHMNNSDGAQQFLAPGSTNGLQRLAGVLVPYGYEVWADGVFQRREGADPIEGTIHRPLPLECYSTRARLSYRPIWVSGLGETIDTQEPLVQLSYITISGREEAVWLNRGQITDQQKLGGLGASGLPVDSLAARDLLAYLRAQEALNGVLLPTLQVGHRSGPYIVEGKLGWLIGRQWIGAGKLEADPRTNQKYTAAFAAKGDGTTWLAKYREVQQEGWVARFLLASTFAPPLLRLVKCRTFIVHHWGPSSHGKTAIAVLGLSAWGNPELLYSSLNRTVISITEVFRHVTDLPVLFDEKQVATVESDQLIYAICTGSGRERGAKEGGLRQDKQTWLTIARTTGEVPLVGLSDVGGQFNRVLQIHSIAFQDRRAAETIYPFVEAHHGHAGPHFLRFLGALVAAEGGVAWLQAQHLQLREELARRIGMNGNHASYAAVIAVAQSLVDAWLLGLDYEQAKVRALDDATMALQETAPTEQLSYAERALSKLRDHWIANPGFYVDDTTDEGRERAGRVFKMVGVETDHGMVYVPHEADELLIKAGYSPERVWRDFGTAGWLISDGSPGGMTRLSLRAGKSAEHPVYLIRREVFFTTVARRPTLRLVHSA